MSKYFIALAPVFYLINVKTVSKGIVRLHKPHGASYPWRAILALNRLVYVGKLVRHLTIRRKRYRVPTLPSNGGSRVWIMILNDSSYVLFMIPPVLSI